MKKFFCVVLLGVSIVRQAHADLTTSEGFEPTILCAAAGVTGYSMGGKGAEVQTAAIGCGIAAVAGLLFNTYYRNKYSRVQDKRIDEMQKAIAEFQQLNAQRAAAGDDTPYSIRVRQIIPGQKLPNGEVTAPTIRERLIMPGDNVRIGD